LCFVGFVLCDFGSVSLDLSSKKKD
jgi:hypothetical protein